MQAAQAELLRPTRSGDPAWERAPQAPDPVQRALGHLAAVQRPDGAWEGEMVWNTMLLSQYVITRSIIAGRHPFDEATRRGMIRAFEVSRLPDGGYGMHAGSGSYVFFTALAYVALRLLGVSAKDPLAVGARRVLRGRVLGIPTWGKLWLAFLGLYEYEGVSPVPPELFLLPYQVPFHPDRFYCHTRYIYLAIANLYGRRFRADLGPIVQDLRRELYDAPYASIDFAAHRHDLAESDLYVRPGLGLRLAYDALAVVERAGTVPGLRRRALEYGLGRILYEMRATRYQGLSPVNGLLNCLAIFAADPAHPELGPSLSGMEAWRWEDGDGIRYAGARSHAWDTAFAMRAALDAPAAHRVPEAVLSGYAFLRATQLRDDLPGAATQRREPVRGGFCFSDGQHRWPVSDCTAEALSALLLVHADPALAPSGEERIEDAWLLEAGRFILARQNDDGGFGSYERRRAGSLLEALNPSEMFGSCMTERSYIECTASCVGALARLAAQVAPYGERARMQDAVRRGVGCLLRAQRPDGSWSAFWGIGHTYAIFHVVEALHAAGVRGDDPAVRRSVRWLYEHQKADGGWGEHWRSCLEDRYVEHPESQAVQTAWALLALLAAGESADDTRVKRAASLLAARQRPDGSWPDEAPVGVFFGTAVLDYRLYKDYFPAWALGRLVTRRG